MEEKLASRKNAAKVNNPMGKIQVKKALSKIGSAPIEFQSHSLEEDTLEKSASDKSSLPVEFNTNDVEDKELVEKEAAFFSPAFKNSAYSALGGLAVAGASSLVNHLWNKRQQNKLNNQAMACLQQAIMLSPNLKRYDVNTLVSYMPMIIKASPTVAKDPRLLANYLESMLDAEGHLNLATFRELSNLESTIIGNNNANNTFSAEFQKGLAKGVGNSVGRGFTNFGRELATAFAASGTPNGALNTPAAKMQAAAASTPGKAGAGNVQ